ncbi:MAG TPA: Gldg family protein, partial [Spirochaetia bacterium]
MGNRAREILVTVLVLVCLGLVLADSSRWFLRLDLTRNKAFSISPVSKTIIRAIPQQVHVTYYLSDTLRSLAPDTGRIADLLDEYAAESRGKVRVTVQDPDAAGRAESARSYGILPQQIQV